MIAIMYCFGDVWEREPLPYSVSTFVTFNVSRLYVYSWGSCHNGMALPQLADRRDCLQVWMVPADVLNTKFRTAHKGWSSSSGVG